MKAHEARKLIGRDIAWLDRRWGRESAGRLIDVKGRNLLVDIAGSNDWKWLDDMHKLRVVESQGGEA